MDSQSIVRDLAPYWKQLLDVYAEKTGRSGRDALSADTMRLLSRYLRLFLAETALSAESPTPNPDELTRSVMTWLASRASSRSGAPMKRSSRQTVATLLGDFLHSSLLISEQHKKLLVNHFRNRQESAWSRYSLSEADIETAILHVLRMKRSHIYTRSRDAAMICVLGTIGPRISSVIELRMEHLQVCEDGWTLSLLRKKGRDKGFTAKPVPYAKMFGNVQAGWILKGFLQERENVKSDYLFATETGTMMSVRDFQKKLARAARDTGIEHLNPHAFRHHAITRIAARSGILQAQIVADHADVQTTQRYINKKSDVFDITNAVL